MKCRTRRSLLEALFAAAVALTVARSSATDPITYSSRDGRVILPAKVKGSGPFKFLLDTGYELTMLNPPHAQSLGLRKAGGVTIVGIAGEERADTFGGAVFDLGGEQFMPRRVASLPSDSRLRGRDGILGSGFFKRFVVEIDSRAKQARLHEPQAFNYTGSGEIIPFTFNGEVPVISVSLALAGKSSAPARLKIDTGCDGGVCLGREFVEQNGWNEAAESGATGTRSGVGGGTKTRRVELSQVQLGKFNAERVTADLFGGAAPGGPGIAGHMGMGILRRFKVTFDYERKRLILETYPVDGKR